MIRKLFSELHIGVATFGFPCFLTFAVSKSWLAAISLGLVVFAIRPFLIWIGYLELGQAKIMGLEHSQGQKLNPWKMAAILTALSAVGLFAIIIADSLFPSSNKAPTRRVTTASGFSADIVQGVYVCHSDNGLSVVLRGPAPEDVTLCQGPEPNEMVRTYEGFRLFVPDAPVEMLQPTGCDAHFHSGTKRRKRRVINYTICSPGGGSGGLEYELYAEMTRGSQTIAATAYTQKTGDAPNFTYVFDALASATVEN